MSMTPDQVRASFGDTPATSPWLEATQELMDGFAAATLDPDWMHVDPERAAKEGPFDGTIAFGFWTLSLLTHFLREVLGQDYPTGVRYGFNYGLNRVRFVRPIPVGTRIRNRMEVVDVQSRDAGRFLVTTRNEIEIEGETGPAMVADWLLLLVY